MLATLARPSLRADVSWRPLDPRWYTEVGGLGRSDAGIAVLPSNAIGIAVVYRAINVRAHSIASIPLCVFKHLGDEGKEKARDHPQYDLLHDRPNAYQTSYRWKHLMAVQRILYGWHYSEILPGPRGVGALVPLSPTTTRPVDQLRDGRLVYVTRDALPKGGYGPERRLLQDEVLHLRGFSLDGKNGIPLPSLAKNAMGLALAAEKHGSMFLRKGARFAGILKAKGRQEKEQREANEAAWQRAHGGSDGSGGTPLLTGDLEWQSVQANNKDSQWLEARSFQVEELLRFLGVPGVLCGYNDKTSTYASAEQFFLSFVTHTVRPEATEIAQEITQSVVTGGPEYYADFILEDLLRGDIQTRYGAYQIAVQSGFMNRNEIRTREGMNKGPDELNEFLVPVAVAQRDERNADKGAPAPRRQEPEDENEDDDEQAKRYSLIALRAVERLVRKEVAAIAGSNGKLGSAKRFAADATGWLSWLATFYTEHAERIAADLGITGDTANTYVTAQVTRLGAGIPDNFEQSSVNALLALVET